jgi:hypothetical protein
MKMKEQHFLDNDLLYKRIIDITVLELIHILNEQFVPRKQNNPLVQEREKKYVYGIKGLAQLLKCCTTTAQSLKNSGKIKGCFYNVGRKLIFDADLVMEKINDIQTDKI